MEDGLRAVGIRAHVFRPEETRNAANVRWVGEMEEPFDWIGEFRFADQSEQSPALWRRFSKETGAVRHPKRLGVAPEQVLLLYE